nr:MAG TPA: hypothetical protein [Caudoviricetes sp.]
MTTRSPSCYTLFLILPFFIRLTRWVGLIYLLPDLLLLRYSYLSHPEYRTHSLQ